MRISRTSSIASDLSDAGDAGIPGAGDAGIPEAGDVGIPGLPPLVLLLSDDMTFYKKIKYF